MVPGPGASSSGSARGDELGQACGDLTSGRLRRVQDPDVLGALAASGGGELRVLEHGPHEPSGGLEIRIGLGAARRIRLAAAGDGRRGPGDQEAVRLGHELQVAAVSRGDDRLSECHRLGHGEPESLGAVQ